MVTSTTVCQMMEEPLKSGVNRNTKVCKMGEFSEREKLTGLRLKNPRYLCFLNTALNSVVSNEKLREKYFKGNI